MDDPGTSIIFKKFEFESMDNPGTLPSQLTHRKKDIYKI